MSSWCCCFNLLLLVQCSAVHTQARLPWSSGIIIAWYLTSNIFVYTFHFNLLVSKTARMAWEKDSILNWNLQMNVYFYRLTACFFTRKDTMVKSRRKGVRDSDCSEAWQSSESLFKKGLEGFASCNSSCSGPEEACKALQLLSPDLHKVIIKIHQV